MLFLVYLFYVVQSNIQFLSLVSGGKARRDGADLHPPPVLCPGSRCGTSVPNNGPGPLILS